MYPIKFLPRRLLVKGAQDRNVVERRTFYRPVQGCPEKPCHAWRRRPVLQGCAELSQMRLEIATGGHAKLCRHPDAGRDPFALLRAERSRRCVWVPADAGMTPRGTPAHGTPQRRVFPDNPASQRENAALANRNRAYQLPVGLAARMARHRFAASGLSEVHQVASWKMMPAVWRRPVRNRLTP